MTSALDWSRKIADAMGNGATAHQGTHEHDARIRLNRTDAPDAELFVIVGGWKMSGRARVRGVFPNHRDIYLNPPVNDGEITVSVDRDPVAIARDITRRCLPGYLADLPRVRDAVAQREDSDNMRREDAAQLAALLREPRITDDGSSVVGYAGKSHVSMRVGGEVSFSHLYVSHEQAMRILAILTEG